MKLNSKIPSFIPDVFAWSGYGVYLSEFTMNPSFELSLRQLAAVMLKKYVESCWSSNDETQTCEQAKKMIKSILPNGLCDPNSKVRQDGLHVISICEY